MELKSCDFFIREEKMESTKAKKEVNVALFIVK